MKNLVLTLCVTVFIIAAGIGISTMTHMNYVNGVASAREYGYEQGFVRGYEDGSIDGSEDGFQEGSRELYARVEGTDAKNSSLSGL